MSRNKTELIEELCSVIRSDIQRVSPEIPPAEVVVPFMTRIVWTIAFLLLTYSTVGILIQ